MIRIKFQLLFFNKWILYSKYSVKLDCRGSLWLNIHHSPNSYHILAMFYSWVSFEWNVALKFNCNKLGTCLMVWKIPQLAESRITCSLLFMTLFPSPYRSAYWIHWICCFSSSAKSNLLVLCGSQNYNNGRNIMPYALNH